MDIRTNLPSVSTTPFVVVETHAAIAGREEVVDGAKALDKVVAVAKRIQDNAHILSRERKRFPTTELERLLEIYPAQHSNQCKGRREVYGIFLVAFVVVRKNE
mgnify:CR=1 FL=1